MSDIKIEIEKMDNMVSSAMSVLINNLESGLSCSSSSSLPINDGAIQIIHEDYSFNIDLKGFYTQQKDTDNWNDFVELIAAGKSGKSNKISEEDYAEWNEWVDHISNPQSRQVWKTENDDIIDYMFDFYDKEIQDVYNFWKLLFDTQHDGMNVIYEIHMKDPDDPESYRCVIKNLFIEIGFKKEEEKDFLKYIFDKTKVESPNLILSFNKDTTYDQIASIMWHRPIGNK